MATPLVITPESQTAPRTLPDERANPHAVPRGQRLYLLLLLACSFALWIMVPAVASAGGKAVYRHLNDAMDRFHASFDVFTDLSAAGNHFAARCAMAGGGAVVSDLSIDETWNQDCRSGGTCIAIGFRPRSPGAWAGWYFQNGVLAAGGQPQCNWGQLPDAGFDLRGAKSLTFWARGERGGERVEFFAGGVGWDPEAEEPIAPYPDSLARVPKIGKAVTLKKKWRRYRIPLRKQDLSYVNGGFGIVMGAVSNPEGGNFFIDDIQYKKRALDEKRFIVSYVTLPSVQGSEFDTILSNVAFVYDNVMVLLAYLARAKPDDLRRARILADSLVYAKNNDRSYSDDRLRNAYQGGDLATPSGWKVNTLPGTARLPGWWDPVQEKWLESEDAVGTSTGNVAWAMIGLLRAHQILGDQTYLAAAAQLGNWVVSNTRDGQSGFTGGFEGWEPSPRQVTWKSTEHNLDLYVAFMTLFDLTGESAWRSHALHAKEFVRSMWAACGPDHFATGTREDGAEPNCDFAPTDVNTWGLMALGEANQFGSGIDWVLGSALVEEGDCFHGKPAVGVDFNDDKDGIWWEGTAHTALALRILGRRDEEEELLRSLKGAQRKAPNGDRRGVVATCRDGVSTGIEDFQFFNRLHIAATAWYALAAGGVNPFWGVSAEDPIPHQGE